MDPGGITGTKEEWKAGIRTAREKVAATTEGMAQEKHDLDLFVSELSDDDRPVFQKMADELNSDNLPNAVTVPESNDPTFTAFHKTFTNDKHGITNLTSFDNCSVFQFFHQLKAFTNIITDGRTQMGGKYFTVNKTMREEKNK